jgi:hypothetical protein
MRSHAPGILRLSDELEALDLGDYRLDQRVLKVIEKLAHQPDKSIPSALGTWAETKAAYRLFDSEKVTAHKILEPHREKTLERMAQHDRVLCIQDTTEIDYTGKNDIEGLGPLNYEARRGLYLHPTLIVTPGRLPLGVFDSWSWTRPLEEAERESVRWIEGYQRLCEAQQHLWEQAFDTQLVYVADREGDLFDLFAEHRRQSEGRDRHAADWLIRSQHNRKLEGGEGDKLKAKVESAPLLGEVEFTLPAAQSRKSRAVRQTLRATRLTLKPPATHPGAEAIEVTALWAREMDPPEGEAPIEWLLLTNRLITTREEAEEALSWYLCRWQIEIFFRILKSGCKIEELQLESIERLEPAIMLYMLIAWRILYLTMIGRECPELPCSVLFDREEWEAVYLVTQRKPPPKAPPTINEVIRWIAGLGGFLNRKGDGQPGPQTLWIGLQRMKDFAAGIAAVREVDSKTCG